MEIKDLKTCLYFTLPKENIEKTYDLGNRYDLNDPEYYRNRFYTAIEHEGNWYMVNTYHFPTIKCNTIERAIRNIKRKQEEAFEEVEDYMFPCKIKLTDETLSLFEFVFDLEECKFVSLEDKDDYRDKDLYKVELFKDHPWPYYLIVAKKETKKDPRKIQGRILYDLSETIKAPRYIEYAAKEAIKELESIEGADKELNEEAKLYLSKIKEYQEELMSLDFKWLDPEDGQIKWDQQEEFLNGKR